MRKEVKSYGAPKPVGPYSQALEVNGVLYLSGQIGIDPETGRLKEGFKEQALQVFKNIENILSSAGYRKEDIVRITVYVTDVARFKDLNEIYSSFLEGVDPKPTRVTVGVSELPLGAQIEVEVIAIKEAS